MHDGFFGFCNKLALWSDCLSYTDCKNHSYEDHSITPRLKSPVVILLSYWEEYRSKFLL